MKVVWTPRAREDLRGVRQFLEGRSPRAAHRIVERLITRVQDQTLTPLAAPLEREGPERCLVVTRTPYLVLYTVSDTELTVVAIYHGARRRP